jgi:two-component system, chemotaxis family, chemotaxis protein CheY
VAVLIVEDNPVNAKLLVFMLRGAGFQSEIAGNGKEALARLSDMSEIQLIITDYMMPEMDGLELIEKVRAVPQFNHIPILIASAHADLETVKRAQRVRCDGFLVKPIDRQQLLNRVGELLRSKPHVLLDKWIIVGKLDVSPGEYDELIKMLCDQVSVALTAAALEQGDVHEPISESLKQLLLELCDSASMLGANRFVQLYSAYKGNGGVTKAHCRLLTQSLQQLETALMAQMSSEPEASGGQAAA